MQLTFDLSGSLLMSLISMLVVFGVLLAIMVMIQLLGALVKSTASPATQTAVAVSHTPVHTAAPAPAAVGESPEVIAAITAAVSEMLRGNAFDIKITKR